MSSRWRWWGLAGMSWGIVLIALVYWRLGGFGSSLRKTAEGPRFPTAQSRTPISVPPPPADGTTNDSHRLSMSALVARANANEQLAPADIQTLLVFISSPKPGELTDGEWEERVNGVLNLLRRQEVSSFQFQVLSGKENDGGEPQGQVRNPSAETSVTSASPRFVSDTDGVSTLRKGAIHAIGQLGTAEDLAVLDSLPQDDLNLSQALLPAKAALTTRTKAAR